MDDDYMGNVAMVVGDVVASELETSIVKAVQFLKEQISNTLNTSDVVYQGLLNKLPVLPPELKDAIMLNLAAEYNGRVSCLLARVVAQAARQRCEADSTFIRHLLQHLEITEAHGLPFAMMGFDPSKENVPPDTATVRLVVLPLADIRPSGAEDSLHRSAKKYSSNN